VITSSIGTDARYQVEVIDLAPRKRLGWKARALVTASTTTGSGSRGMGRRCGSSPTGTRRAIGCAIDLARAAAEWQRDRGEQSETLQQGTIIGNS
jgi:prolyl oligopeptidase